MADLGPTTKKMARTCNMCRTRMSTIDLDPHLICSACRGSNCNTSDRCNECVLWSDDKIATYVTHHKALERKRKSKETKKTVLDAVCTGPGSALSEEGVGDGVVDDSPSATGSASATEVYKLVDNKLAGFGRGLRADLDSDWGIKFKAFSESIISAMSNKIDSLRDE